MSNKQRKQLRARLSAGTPDNHCSHMIFHPEHKISVFCKKAAKYYLKLTSGSQIHLCYEHMKLETKSATFYGRSYTVEIIEERLQNLE